MKKYRLGKLTLQGYRSFDGPTEVVFPQTGLVMVAGPSGSGKTSLLEAISFCLGHQKSPATKIASWRGIPLSASLLLHREDGVDMTIKRTDKGVSVAVGEEKARGRAGEELIERELGVPIDVLGKLTHRRQKRRSHLFSMGDEELKDFLAAALPDLVRFEVEAVTAAGAAETARAEAAGAATVASVSASIATALPGGDVAMREAAVATAQAAAERAAAWATQRSQHREALGRAENAAAAARVEALRARQAVARAEESRLRAAARPEAPAELRAAVTDIESMLRVCEEKERGERDAESRAVQAWSRARGEFDRGVILHEHGVREHAKDVEALAKARAELETTQAGACPTCGQAWATDSHTQHIKQLQTRVAVLALAVASHAVLPPPDVEVWAAANPQPMTGGATIEALVTAGRMLREDLAAARAAVAAWVAEASAGDQILLARYAAEVTSLGVEIVAAQRESDDLRAAKDDELQAVGAARAARAELLAAETALRREEQVAKAKADMEDKAARERAAAEEAEARARVAEDYAAAVGRNGFLGRIFDELLVEIADATNAALADVPNVTDCSLAFRSEVVGAKGKAVRQNIVPVLTIGGQEIVGRDLDGASGGMQSAVELAADFAGILGVVERRLGWSPGWVMIDEAFEGLDASSREATVEYLRALARDRLVLVIDHGSEIGGLFESRIVVKSENRKSRVANG